MPIETNRVLVKMRPSNALRAGDSRVNLQPLFARTPATMFGMDTEPQWFIAELPEAAANPWDLAHSRVGAQLGVAESDVIFAEPDIVHDVYRDTEDRTAAENFGATVINCVQDPQDATRGKAVGPAFAWHLGDDFTQLRRAREEVKFAKPRTLIAHIDTGYFASHVTRPANLRHDLERNFASVGDPGSAVDPNVERRLFDNSGHGTGTISILAGGTVPSFGEVMGAAPDADVVPIRVADSVVLLRTSALARALAYTVEIQCDVITMSMGGLPSQAWADAVDRLYEAGIVFCAAGGNRTRPLPPKVLVYPARYPRVIAVVGVMANRRPYKNLERALEGSFGPDAAMKKALAAYTPNIPWARFGCDDIVRLNGEGTSSATPQVAAAAALWIEKHKKVLPRNWRRVEAVRKALYTTARKDAESAGDSGNGVIQAFAALGVQPDLTLPISERSSNRWAFLRLISGRGLAETPGEQMFNLELAQRWVVNERLQELVSDPDDLERLEGDRLKKVMEAVIEDEGASLALRKHVAARYPIVGGGPAPRTFATRDVLPQMLIACDTQPEPPTPPHRRLRVYAVDPSLSTRLATASMNEVALKVRWEKVAGGVGEYLKFDEDYDPSGRHYPPVDLDDPRLLAQDGWAPSEGNPQFHQQMVYAVAMKTIGHFEKALGRPVLWRPYWDPENDNDDSGYIGQLNILPHALRQSNAYYSPRLVSLQFGFFEAAANDPGEHMPGSRVYSCLSHDIIAHETTHAILDGMHRRFNEATNPDVLAFHEAFADIVALMQHFTIPEVLETEIARTRGDIEAESRLGMLAVQFGKAMGGRGALRNAIGRMENGVWKRIEPDPSALQRQLEPHTRGAIMVAAVFDAFIAIYNMRVADLMRIYTGGTGVLPDGAIHPDMVKRLAAEAAKAATHVLEMCIRALDYLPPVDVTFVESLRALITADFDIVGQGHEYRVAFVEAFRRRGIYPHSSDASAPRTLSVATLQWQSGVDMTKFTAEQRRELQDVFVATLKRYAEETIYIHDREELFRKTRAYREKLHGMLKSTFAAMPALAEELGLDPTIERFEVHSLRSSIRIGGDGRSIPQVVVALTQSKKVEAEAGADADDVELPKFRGGSTLVIDLTVPEVKYRIVKNIASEAREERTRTFLAAAAADPLRALLVAPSAAEHFGALHALAED